MSHRSSHLLLDAIPSRKKKSAVRQCSKGLCFCVLTLHTAGYLGLAMSGLPLGYVPEIFDLCPWLVSQQHLVN
jgi:hypothetical protein